MRFDFDCERCGSHVAWTTEDICADCMAQERDEEMADLRRQLAAVTAERDAAYEQNHQLRESNAVCREVASDIAGLLPHAKEAYGQVLAERDAARAERDEAQEALSALEDLILERLPYQYDDGEDPPNDATAEECIGYAADEIKELRKERDAARAEVARLRDLVGLLADQPCRCAQAYFCPSCQARKELRSPRSDPRPDGSSSGTDGA